MILVRHGQMAGDPFAEPERPVVGCLSDLGVRQATRTARALTKARIDAALSSPYGRALQTAQIVLEGRDAPIRIVDGLKEWLPNPELETMPSTEHEHIVEQSSELYAEQTWKTDLGEGCYDMYARMVPPFLAALAETGVHHRMGGFVPGPQAGEVSVAVFAHGGTLNVLLSFLLGVPPFPVGRFSFELAGYGVLEFTPRKGIYYPQLVLRAPDGDDV